MHQSPHRKDKGGRCRPKENIRTSHGQGHSKVAGSHVQKGVPAPVDQIDKNIARKDLALTKDIPNALERIGWAGIGISCDDCCGLCFDVVTVFLLAGIVQAIARDKDTVAAAGIFVGNSLDWFADLVDNIGGCANMNYTKDGIGKEPGVTPIEIIVGTPVEVEFRGNPSHDGNGIQGNCDGKVESKGRLQATIIVLVVGIVHFVRGRRVAAR